MFESWYRRTFLAFGHRGYFVLWLGSTFAFTAFGMASVVQGVVAYNITGRNGSVGAVSLGMGVAQLVIAPFGGVLADRLAKRRLLLIGQSLIGMSFLAVAILIKTGHITILALALSSFVQGAVFSFIGPARNAWIGELLKGPALPNGIALQQLGMTVTRVIGPFVAGALVAFSFSGTAGTYFVMAGLFVLVVGTLWQVPGGEAPADGARLSVAGAFAEGWRHMRSRPRLLLLSGSFIGFVISGFSYQVLVPAYIANELHRPAGSIGVMYGVSGLAGLIATVVLAGVAGSAGAFRIMAIFGVLMAIGLGLMAGAGSFWLVLLAMVIIGAGSSGYQLLNNSLVMRESDPAYYGRVMANVMMAWGLSGLVAYPYGRLADAIGERPTLWLMSGLVLAVVLVAFVLSLRIPDRRRIEPPTPAVPPRRSVRDSR